MKNTTTIPLVLAILIAGAGIVLASFPENQDASIEKVYSFEDEENEVRYTIGAITDVYGPFEIQINSYSESGEKIEVLRKEYDGSYFIPAGNKIYDWIEVDPVKLHAGYNIITVKIVFGPLNAVPEINPANNMGSMIYYLPEPPEPEENSPPRFGKIMPVTDLK